MASGRRNPFEEIESLIDRMTQGFEADFGMMASTIALDVADHDEEFVVTADLPGFDKAEIDVTLSNDTLHIQADRETDVTEEDATYLRRERQHAAASRSIQLPEPVDEEAIGASFSNGVLTVTLPKRGADESGKRIEID